MQQTKENDRKILNEEEFEFIRKILDGDTNSFRILQKRYKTTISTLIRKMIKNEDDVEDLTQETFIKAYNALSGFQFGYSFSSWIYRIASNTCIDFLRKKRFQTFSINQVSFDGEEESEYEIEDKSYMPDLNLMSDEKKKALSDAITSLPDNYRKIIMMRHVEELDYNDIAEKLDLPLGTVKAHLFRARKILFNSLKDKVYLFKED